MLDLKKSKFLSKEKLSEIAPSIFTMKPSNTVSDKYTHIPTERVIDDMELMVGSLLMPKKLKQELKIQEVFKSI